MRFGVHITCQDHLRGLCMTSTVTNRDVCEAHAGFCPENVGRAEPFWLFLPAISKRVAPSLYFFRLILLNSKDSPPLLTHHNFFGLRPVRKSPKVLRKCSWKGSVHTCHPQKPTKETHKQDFAMRQSPTNGHTLLKVVILEKILGWDRSGFRHSLELDG